MLSPISRSEMASSIAWDEADVGSGKEVRTMYTPLPDVGRGQFHSQPSQYFMSGTTVISDDSDYQSLLRIRWAVVGFSWVRVFDSWPGIM